MGSDGGGDDGDDDGDENDGDSGVTNDIIKAITKAFQLNDAVNGSQQNFLSILAYGKDLYRKGDSILQGSLRLLAQNGYKGPKNMFICLNDSQPCNYSILYDPEEQCQYCNTKGSSCIKYSYSPLADKVIRWCSNKDFCRKMTAHWAEKDRWLNADKGSTVKREIWDGDRFCELSWFWDPVKKWILPTCCPSCRSVLSSDIIKDVLDLHTYTIEEVQGTNVSLECPACYTKFSHSVTITTGDPRNIALIGHWDGWQPFSTSSKHSSGEVLQ